VACLTISMPESLKNKATFLALSSGRSISGFVVDAINTYITEGIKDDQHTEQGVGPHPTGSQIPSQPSP
jgi:hypothetical protein